MTYKLDKYEEEIENNFDKQHSIKTDEIFCLFQNAARIHLKKKHLITTNANLG